MNLSVRNLGLSDMSPPLHHAIRGLATHRHDLPLSYAPAPSNSGADLRVSVL